MCIKNRGALTSDQHSSAWKLLRRALSGKLWPLTNQALGLYLGMLAVRCIQKLKGTIFPVWLEKARLVFIIWLLGLRRRVVPLSRSRLSETVNKPGGKMALWNLGGKKLAKGASFSHASRRQDFTRPFFFTVLLFVMHNRLSQRGTTPSLVLADQ